MTLMTYPFYRDTPINRAVVALAFSMPGTVLATSRINKKCVRTRLAGSTCLGIAVDRLGHCALYFRVRDMRDPARFPPPSSIKQYVGRRGVHSALGVFADMHGEMIAEYHVEDIPAARVLFEALTDARPARSH